MSTKAPLAPRPSKPSRQALPGKGWCFHRGAKLTVQVQNRLDPLDKPVAIWYCPSCQNYTALHGPLPAGLTTVNQEGAS